MPPIAPRSPSESRRSPSPSHRCPSRRARSRGHRKRRARPLPRDRARYRPTRRRGGALRAAFPCAHSSAHHERALWRALFPYDLMGEATAGVRFCCHARRDNKTGQDFVPRLIPNFSQKPFLYALHSFQPRAQTILDHVFVLGFGASGFENGRLINGMAEAPAKVCGATSESPHRPSIACDIVSRTNGRSSPQQHCQRRDSVNWIGGVATVGTRTFLVHMPT